MYPEQGLVEQLENANLAGQKNEKIGARALNASAILLFGVIYNRTVFLATTVVLARLLSPEDFGLVALGTSLLTILLAITELSLGSALIHQKEITEDDFHTAFTLGAIRGVLLAALMVVSGYIMAEAYHDERLIGVCAGLAVRPLLTGLGSPKYITYSKELSFGTVAFQEGLNFTIQFVVSVAWAYLTDSYWAIVAGTVAASVVGTVMTYMASPYVPKFSFRSLSKLLHFSIWLTLNQAVSAVGNRFDNFLAGGWLGIATFGAYNVGNNTAGLITQSAILPLQRVLFPSFAKISHDKQRVQSAFQRSQSSLFAIGMAVGAGQALVAEPFVYLALGPHWPVAILVIQVIAPILGWQIVFGPANALASALGETKMLFNRTLLLLIFRVPIVFIGLYFYGLPGLLISRAISGGIVVSIVNIYVVKKLTGLTLWDQLGVTWRSWVSGLAMAAVVLGLGANSAPISSHLDAAYALAWMISVGGIVYCGVHAFLWVVGGRSEIGIEAEIAKVLAKIYRRYRKIPQRSPL
ncbi:lipopolysaccharide biosynthesis protein [Rhizobium leguminosarum]|nr:lipopolysaccharide biosynthesis protein [Rhizobium leguminosarum]TAV13928.1 lipopolysaccharide biosynthesis protein [Rhizobium leguminosarum]TAW54778.1 lipopolysaccharide biosynthesis protein [Rhizobium leguminosarum]TAX53703.1 lipopolysaccharide biosynthesis protein [Rhizobium leguminosarum]TAY40218.1 lipopolysaccharide biosynthesis protein [Rhizobium leguminosarum]